MRRARNEEQTLKGQTNNMRAAAPATEAANDRQGQMDGVTTFLNDFFVKSNVTSAKEKNSQEDDMMWLHHTHA